MRRIKARCIISGREGAEAYFLAPIAPESDNVPIEPMPLAKAFHREIRALGAFKMSLKYPQVKSWLDKYGWFYDAMSCAWQQD